MTGHQIEQAAHSPIGASSCERWWNCPGSVKLSETLPDSEGTVYTATGTVAHTIGEAELVRRIEKSRGAIITETMDDEIGRSYVEDGHEIEVDEDMINAVQIYVDTVNEYIEDHGLSWGHDLRVEVKFDLTHIDAEAFGTCDAVIVAPMNRIIVVDYKHGKGHAVEVENNHQLQYYALGAYYALPASDQCDIEYVEMVIVQPRARHLDGPVRRFAYRVRDLLAFETELTQAIARVRNGDPTLLGGSWCKFCNAKPVCPETRRVLQEATRLAFDKIDVEKIKPPAPATLTPDQVSMLVDNAEILKSWIQAVISLGTRIAQKGEEIPGYKLVTKYGRRRWINERDVEKAFGLEFSEKIFNKKLKSPAQMEKLLGKKRVDEIASFVEVPVSGTSLVREDDSRDGVSTGAAAAFAEDWRTP